MSIIAIQYYNKLQQFLIYKGKKNKTENIFKNLLISRAKKNKSAFVSQIECCKYNATPYIRLKTRRKGRGKRVLYRVSILKKNRSEKESVSSFGKHIRSQIGKNFEESLEKEIKALSIDKTHTVRLNRDKIHELARKFAPRGWFKKIYLKYKKFNRRKQVNKNVFIIK